MAMAKVINKNHLTNIVIKPPDPSVMHDEMDEKSACMSHFTSTREKKTQSWPFLMQNDAKTPHKDG